MAVSGAPVSGRLPADEVRVDVFSDARPWPVTMHSVRAVHLPTSTVVVRAAFRSPAATVDAAVAELAERVMAPVRNLAEVAAGARVDRPVYVLDEVPAGAAFRAPAGPHAGHPLFLRKVRRDPTGRTGSVECARCRVRWSFHERDDPGQDAMRWRPAGEVGPPYGGQSV